jgi:SAM-dependent methyltransferase
MKSPTSKLANSLLTGLKGVEMGASAHNPFGLDTINVDWTDSLDTSWKQEELQHCGETAKVDVVADGADLPFENNQWDFVISSHCLEHNWDTIAALKEWIRVVKVGGYVFTIFPHPERTFDKGRPRTTLEELIARHEGRVWPPNMNGLVATPHTWVLFHHTVWHLEDALRCVSYIGGCEVVAAEEYDDKVGNGFTFVIKKTDPLAGSRIRTVKGDKP